MRTQTELGRALQEARQQTDELFKLVREDALYARPIAERHRLIFYRGHLEAFDWNLLARYALDAPAFDASLDQLFAFGIDPPPGELPNDQPSDWPALAVVDRYRERTRNRIDDLVSDVPDQLVHAAVEHRLMHAETFAYILHQLPYQSKIALNVELERAPPMQPRWIDIPSGIAHLGLAKGAEFGWDNEFEPHDVPVPAFAMAQYKVTNGEYLDYVLEGADAPYFWARRDGVWMFRGMFSEYPLPLDAPVYVTQEQAEAFARWRGMRLPTEAEYHRGAEGAPPSANVNFRGWDPTPVTADDGAANGAPARPMQIAGNGWEWTSSVFAPFPGFKPFPFYRNYSEPFFDGAHFVLKGASPRTAKCFLRESFRNWFRPSYPYVYATFRMVRS
jgi:iron(II)-dependent oxidoreductase